MKNKTNKSNVGRLALAAAFGTLLCVGCANEQLYEPAGSVPRTPTVENTRDLSRTGPSTKPADWTGAWDLQSQWWSIESFE
jgi:hypothetical protein